MSAERDWVETVKADIEATLARKGVTVRTGYRLPYALQVFSYRSNSNEPAGEQSHGYQTDLLISEQLAGTDNCAQDFGAWRRPTRPWKCSRTFSSAARRNDALK